mgnify:CR=1 FL=1
MKIASTADSGGYGVYAQLFGLAGFPSGGEFRVNATSANDQVEPVVAPLADGRIITESIASRYVFPGITKRYSIAVPRDICRGGKASLRFETDGDSVEREVELPRACG